MKRRSGKLYKIKRRSKKQRGSGRRSGRNRVPGRTRGAKHREERRIRTQPPSVQVMLSQQKGSDHPLTPYAQPPQPRQKPVNKG